MTVKLHNSERPALEYVGHWVENLKTGALGIITSVNGQFAEVIQPTETETRTVHCSDLKLEGKISWNDQGIPTALARRDPASIPDPIVKLADIPQSVLRKFAKGLPGCWVERFDEYYLVVKYREGATSDYLLAVQPVFGDIGAVEIDEDLRIIPPQFREWGWNRPEFLEALEAATPQPEDENTKPEEEETARLQDDAEPDTTNEEPEAEDAEKYDYQLTAAIQHIALAQFAAPTTELKIHELNLAAAYLQTYTDQLKKAQTRK